MSNKASRWGGRLLLPSISTTLSLIGVLTIAGQALADSTTVPMPTTKSTTTVLQGGVSVSVHQTYTELQGIWDATYKLDKVANDALQQGHYWEPRADWLDYYSTTMGQAISALKTEMASLTFPSDKQGLFTDDLAKMQSLLQSISKSYDEFQKSVQGDPKELLKLKFHEPAKAIVDNAQSLDQLLLGIYAKLGPNAEAIGQATAGGETSLVGMSSPTSNSSAFLKGGAQVLVAPVGIKAIGEASDKMHHTAFELIGELERWNLLWGQPTGNGPANYMYGGGLTPQEIYSQYRYLPNVAFTFPSYVQRFSYRLPPREHFLVMYTTQIGKLINLMGTEIEDTKIPQEKQLAAEGPWNTVQTIFKDVVDNYMSLLKMVNETTDNRLKKDIREDELQFGKPVIAIYDDMDQLQHVLGDLKQIISD